jgi:predicted Zn-dependent protease
MAARGVPTEILVDRSLVLILAVLAAWPAAAGAARPPAAGVAAQAQPPVEYRRGLEALRAGRVDRAHAAALSILGAQPQQPAGRQLLGLVKIKRGDLAGAVAEFDRALVSDPQFIAAREERAVTLARMGKSEKARVDLDALKARAAVCAKACPPELRPAVSRVEAALAAGRPATAMSDASAIARTGPAL